MPFNRFEYSDAILQRTDLSPGARCVYQFLVNRADVSGCCWPSFAFIAKRCGMTRRHTRRLIGLLDSAGFIRVERRTYGGKRRDSETNLYTVRDPKSVEVGTPQPLGGWGPTDPQGGGVAVPKVGTHRPPKQSIEQSIEQTTGVGGDCVSKPDAGEDFKKAAMGFGLRRIDKLREAGVTVTDLETCHGQGHRDGLLVHKAIERANRRKVDEEAAAANRLMWAPKTEAEADSGVAARILNERGTFADRDLRGQEVFKRARDLVGCTEYEQRILDARQGVVTE